MRKFSFILEQNKTHKNQPIIKILCANNCTKILLVIKSDENVSDFPG